MHPNWLGFCHNDLQCGNVMLDTAPPRQAYTQKGRSGGTATISMVRLYLNHHTSLEDAWTGGWRMFAESVYQFVVWK